MFKTRSTVSYKLQESEPPVSMSFEFFLRRLSPHPFINHLSAEYNDNGKLRVKGVVVRQLRSSHDVIVHARKEVILSAGAFESSKLLMLSGIGPARHLSELGVPLIKHLPVGQTLYEHMGVMGPVFTVTNANDGLVNLEEILTVK